MCTRANFPYGKRLTLADSYLGMINTNMTITDVTTLINYVMSIPQN
jgi:hypothetical protein